MNEWGGNVRWNEPRRPPCADDAQCDDIDVTATRNIGDIREQIGGHQAPKKASAPPLDAHRAQLVRSAEQEPCSQYDRHGEEQAL